MTGRKRMNSAAFGAVGMCITGHLMELWETPFAGCGKVPFTFPWAVNGVSHGGMAGYAHFHCAIFFVFQRNQSSAHSIGQRPMKKRSKGTRSQLRHGAVRGIGGLPQQAVLRSKTAECVPLCLACQFFPEFCITCKYYLELLQSLCKNLCAGGDL